MQYSQVQLKTVVYAEFGGQTECIMGNWKIENWDVAAFQPGRISLFRNILTTVSHNKHVTPQAFRVHVTSVLCKGVSVALQATVETLYGK